MSEPILVCSSTIPSLPRSERGRPAKIDASPQGEFLVYPSAKVVSLLRTSDLSLVHIFREHRFDTTAVRFSVDGEFIASGDRGGEVFVWQTSAPFEMKYKHSIGGEIADIVWSPDSSKIAVVGDGRPVYFDLKTGSSGADLTCHSRRIESIAIHPNEKEKLILMASHDSRVSVFDKQNGGYRPKYSHLLTTHIKEVYSVSFNADGSLFATGGADGRVVVYDTATRNKMAERQHDRSITSTVFVSLPSLDEGDTVDEGKRRREILVYGSTDGSIRAVRCGDSVDENGQWEEVAEEWEVREQGNIQRLALTGSSSIGCVFALNSDGRLNKLRASNGSLITSLYGHKGHIKAIDIQEEITVTGDNTGRLCIDRGNGVEWFGKERTVAIRGISLLSEEAVVVCLRLNNQMEFISLINGELISSYPLPSEPRSISKGRNTVAVICHKHILIVDRKTKEIIVEDTLSIDPVSVSLLHDGSQLTIGDTAGVVTVYSITGSTLTLIESLKVKGGAVSTMEYSPDGVYLAVSDASRYVSVYRREDWSVVVDEWRMHNASIKSMGWSQDGHMIATGAIDRSLIVWRLPQSEKKFDPIVQKSGHIPEALIWRSSSEIVTVGEDGCRIQWRLE